MEEFLASKVHLQPATWLTGKFPSRRISRHYIKFAAEEQIFGGTDPLGAPVY